METCIFAAIPYNLNIHEKYMNRCLELAAKAAGSVAPNPMVGAVLVFNEMIIGEGYHEVFGAARLRQDHVGDGGSCHFTAKA